MEQHTPGPWRIPVANVFRVVSPEAPHQNKPAGMCPPYPWAVVCETDPKSVGGEQAAANARLIAAAPDLLAACEAALKALDALFSFYGQGLDVLNWHKNGDAEPWDTFFDDNTTGTEITLLRAAIAKATATA